MPYYNHGEIMNCLLAEIEKNQEKMEAMTKTAQE
jgi:anaerobic ribonucleoside-triphosphate reductase